MKTVAMLMIAVFGLMCDAGAQDAKKIKDLKKMTLTAFVSDPETGLEKQVATVVMKYNEHGDTTENSQTADGETHTVTYEYKYDGKDRMTEMVYRNQNNLILQKAIKTYKDDGSWTEKTEDMSNDENFTVTTTEYNAKGKPTGAVRTDTHGKNPQKRDYKYNEKDQLTEVTTFAVDGKKYSTIEYHYDANGNQIEEVFKDAAGRVRQWTKQAWNDHKDIVEQSQCDAKGDAVRKVEISYKYDVKGNQSEAEAKFYTNGELAASQRAIFTYEFYEKK